jgi:hypothetical protein
MKCFVCKKTHIIVFTCKCGKIVCLKHRMQEEHTCIQPELFKVESYSKDKIIKI